MISQITAPDSASKRKFKDNTKSAEPFSPSAWNNDKNGHANAHAQQSIGHQRTASPLQAKAAAQPVTVQINSDLAISEAFESQALINANPFCPFCFIRLNVDKMSMSEYAVIQNIRENRFFFVHLGCYMAAKDASLLSSSASLIIPSTIKRASLRLTSQNFIESSNFVRLQSKSIISATVQLFHPVSNRCFAKLEKILTPLEHFTHKETKIAFASLLASRSLPTNPMIPLFEPNFIVIPCHDFRVVITLYTHSNEDPYTFDFLVQDLSLYHSPSSVQRQPLEIHYSDAPSSNNNLSINGEITNDQDLLHNVNYRVPLLDSSENYILLKQLVVYLPLFKPIASGPALTLSPRNSEMLNHETLSQGLERSPSAGSLQPHPQFYPNHSMGQSPMLYPMSPGLNDMKLMSPSLPYQSKTLSKFKPAAEKDYPGDYPNDGQEEAPLMSPGKVARMTVANDDLIKQNLNAFINKDDVDKDNLSEDVESLIDEEALKTSIQNTILNNEESPKQKQIPDFTRMPRQMMNMNLFPLKNDSNYSFPTSGRSTPGIPSHRHEQQQQHGKRENYTGQKPSQFKRERTGSVDINKGFSTNQVEIDNIFELDIVPFAKTKDGSKMLQRFFNRCQQSEMDFVLQSIENNLYELMTNQYGNFMFKNLIQNCTYEQRYQLLTKLAPVITHVAVDAKGTHALQSVIALVNKEEEEILISQAVKEYLPKLIMDPQATHFIQKIVTIFSLKHIEPIYEILTANFVTMANHQFGLCVLKAMMLKVKENLPRLRHVIDLLTQNTDILVQDPFGNYAIQYAFELYKRDLLTGIMDRVHSKLVQFSLQKFASNVVETCLTTNPTKFIKTVCQPGNVVELMKNKYGNFVLQRALKESSDEEFSQLYSSISANLGGVNLKKYKEKWQGFVESCTKKSMLSKYLNSNTESRRDDYNSYE